MALPTFAKKYYNGDISHMWGTEANAVAFPDEKLPEVAFIGRSNVGKSSIINAIAKRKKLARTSSTPGATRAVHFYEVPEAFRIVDLPGYGFAKMSKTLSALVAKLTEDYFESRRTLKKVFVLIDARHGIRPMDKEVINYLCDLGIQVQIIMTKMDKARGKGLQDAIEEVKTYCMDMAFVDDEIILSSSEKGTNIDVARMEILKVCGITK